jgi:hypothetical protein
VIGLNVVVRTQRRRMTAAFPTSWEEEWSPSGRGRLPKCCCQQLRVGRYPYPYPCVG